MKLTTRQHLSTHAILSGLGSALVLLASLFFIKWYTLEDVGLFGLILSWISLLALISNLKLYSFGMQSSDLARSNGFFMASVLWPIGISLLVFLILFCLKPVLFQGWSFVTTGFLTAISLGVLGISLGQPLTARLQRDADLNQLGFARFMRGILFLLLTWLLSKQGLTGLLWSLSLSHLSAAIVMGYGWKLSSIEWPDYLSYQNAFFVSGTSLVISVTDTTRLQLLYMWIAPQLMGLYVYFSRLVRGAHIWPGMVYADFNMATFSKTQDFGQVKALLRKQTFGVVVVSVIAVVFGLFMFEQESRGFVKEGSWIMVILIESALVFFLLLHRPFPALLGQSKWQWKSETIGFFLSITVFGSVILLFPPTAILYLLSSLVPIIYLTISYKKLKSSEGTSSVASDEVHQL